MTTRFWRFCFFSLSLFLASPVLREARSVPADLTEFSRDARAIVRGRVVALDPRWSDDRRSIETIVTLEVEGYLKGTFGQTVQFRVSGGTLGRFRSVTVGAPEFAIDEHIVVFLGANGPTVPHVLGLNQGVFRVARASSGWVVTPPATVPPRLGIRAHRPG